MQLNQETSAACSLLAAGFAGLWSASFGPNVEYELVIETLCVLKLENWTHEP